MGPAAAMSARSVARKLSEAVLYKDDHIIAINKYVRLHIPCGSSRAVWAMPWADGCCWVHV